MYQECRPSRRHFLQHLAGLSLVAAPALGFVQALRAAAPALRKDRKSLIILWMSGGPPTIDLWDLKSGRPTGGEFRPIRTSASGIEICEHLPTVAQQMHRLAVVRSLTTGEGDHKRGRVLMHTARPPSPIVNYPSMGAVAAQELGRQDGPLPPFIAVGGPAEGPGFLGMGCAPLTVQNAGQPPDNLRPPDVLGQGLTQGERVHRRQRLFYALEDAFASEHRGEAALAHEQVYTKAFRLAASPLGKVFSLGGEKKSVLDEYGNTSFGRGCLLSRRLVESGVTCVEVDLGGWDLHRNVFPALRDRLLPELDRGMGALVRDLADRGMWKNTVILWVGEFGRTPQVNANAGRDHWTRCWSVVIGGGGLKGGYVHGETDANGTAVKGDAISVGDLFATVYKALGLDPAAQLRDNLGRPLPLAEGKPIAKLLA